MPAKKIIDAVGSTFSVIGSSMATAVAGPMPGSTPTAVPMLQPSSAHSRLIGRAGGDEALHQIVQDVHVSGSSSAPIGAPIVPESVGITANRCRSGPAG